MATIEDTTITFCGVVMERFQLTKQLPFPIYKSRLKEHYMTEGTGGAGIRVLEPLGAHVSYCDFEFRAGFLTSANIITFETAFFDQRTPKTLIITVPDDSTVTYKVLFAEDGFQPSLQDAGVEYYEDLYMVDFKLKILNKV